MATWQAAGLFGSALAIATIATGCAPPMLANPHDHGGGMVDEYRPDVTKPTERRVADSAEYVLWRWQPLPTAAPPSPTGELLAPTTGPTTAPAAGAVAATAGRWTPVVQVEHVYVHHGQPVGFRRRADGQLLAVAGPHVRPLEPGRYCWHRLVGEPRRSHVDVAGIATVGLIVIGVAGVVAGIVAIDHNDRHAHVGSTILNTVFGGGDDGD